MKRKGIYIWQKAHTYMEVSFKVEELILAQGVTSLWDTVPNSTARETDWEF